jgi:hypothetical protein
VDPTAGLDDVDKRKFLSLPGLELRTLGRSARSQLLYRLRYPGSIAWHRQECLASERISRCFTRKAIWERVSLTYEGRQMLFRGGQYQR